MPVSPVPARIVCRLVDAFNARDLDEMLVCLAADVDFHPLRLSGLHACYRGHDGVPDWFARLEHLRHDYRMVLGEMREVGDGRVFAGVSLSQGPESNVGPFSAMHRINGGLIVAVHIESLGLIP